MTRLLSCMLFLIFLLSGTTGICSTFDQRLWEKYAGIEVSTGTSNGSLAGVYLEPAQMGDVTGTPPFADLRVVTDQKQEVPWQVIERRPEKQKEELPARMRNLSRTEAGDTWLELQIDKQQAQANAVEIVTSNTDFSRQVQVLGSQDGKSWNSIRKDGVIFDLSRGDKLRHTRISFPQASFRYLGVKIINGDAQPLSITGVKAYQDSDSQGQTYSVQGRMETPENSTSNKESSIVVRLTPVFPVDRLTISTTERNFQRCVEVQTKRANGEWQHWAQGTIFSFDTPALQESQLTFDIPEITASEIRLVFKNLDSPPLTVTGVNGEGYRRLLVFKEQAGQKLYLFWGNPEAHQPTYDLAGLVAKQKPDELPIGYLGPKKLNSNFAGNAARLPFTERYKYLLYVVVSIAIAGLIFVQYRVFKRVEP